MLVENEKHWPILRFYHPLPQLLVWVNMLRGSRNTYILVMLCTYVYNYIYILSPTSMPGMALNILKITLPACDTAATCQFDATWQGKHRVCLAKIKQFRGKKEGYFNEDNDL